MENNLHVALAVFLTAVMSAVFLLLAFYEEGSQNKLSIWTRRIAKRWEFTPAQAGGFDGFRWLWPAR